MATNEILRFCETDTKSNVLTQAEYETDSERMIGNQPGVARAKFVNKVLRQTSAVAAGVGQFIADAGLDCNDSQTPAAFASNIRAGILNWGRAPAAAATGSANKIIAKFSSSAPLNTGSMCLVRAAYANTGAVTFARGESDTPRAIYKDNNTPLAAGDIKGAGQWLELVYDGTLGKWCLTNPYITPSLDFAKILDFIYPVGSVYTTFDNGFTPSVKFGGSWLRVSSGLFLQAASATETLGTEIAAGLPSFTASWRVPSEHTYGDAVFNTFNDPNWAIPSVSGSNTAVYIDPANRNDIYGKSDTVQPPAILVAMWQRTA